MNTPRWERAKEIFDAAIDLSSEARSSYLQANCGDDQELRLEVEGLLDADAKAGSFMNPAWLAPFSPFVPEPEFQLVPGDVVSDRFKIVRSLGDGGMGRVYEAHDSVLGVQVALKTLRPEISSNPEVLFRFRQEVRIAHKITHPNVCRTYHFDHEFRKVGEDESSSFDLTFLTMEYLEGETLQQLLKRAAPIPLQRVLSIARQMAKAIEAAHQIGITHRDIKPGNIMICPAPSGISEEERVVITDFGLAKLGASAINDHSSISQPGQTMGTLTYMSPEQLKGDEVSPATDIYAFGLILYEMVTGVKAFPDANTMVAAYRRITEPPPSPKAISPDLPAPWEMAILGCLQIDPAKRFQHASEAIEILDGSLPYSSRLRTLQHPKSPHFLISRRRVLTTGISLVACMALSGLGFRYYTTRGDSTVAPGTLVYLAPVKNETGEKQLDNVTELVRAGLEQSAHINLLDEGRVGDILQQMTKPADTAIDSKTGREIAMRAGAARVVFPTITGDATRGRYDLHIEIQQPDNSPSRSRARSERSWSWNASHDSNVISSDLLSVVREGEDWIRSKVGESSGDIARLDVPPADVTTSSWDALSDYAYGEKLFAQGKREDAIVALRSAVQKDPSFALAQGFLGDILTNAGHQAEGAHAYSLALDANLGGHLSLRERDRIKGMVAFDTFDLQAAEAAYREYTLYYEHDYSAWFRRARPLFLMGRTHEAIGALERAHLADASRPIPLLQLSGAEMVVDDQPAVDRSLSELKAKYANDYYLYALAPVQFVRAEYESAAASLETLRNSQSPAFQWAGAAILANLRAEQGRFDEALQILTSRIQADPANASLLVARARLHCRLLQANECVRDLDEAMRRDSSADVALSVVSTLGPALTSVPRSSAAHTSLRMALQKLETRPRNSEDGLRGDLLLHRVRGEALLADGQAQAAISEFRKTAALDPSNQSREYLARGLIAMADQAPHNERQPLLEEALAITASMALHPAVVWEFSQYYPPGFYADQLELWLSIDRSLSLLPSRSIRDRVSEMQRHTAIEKLRRLRPLRASDFLHATGSS